MRLALIAAIVLVGAGAWAADVTIAGADKPVPTHSFADLTVKLAEGDRASWTVYPQPVKKVNKGDGNLYLSGPPGAKYQVSVTVVNFDTRRFDTGTVEVVMDGPVLPTPKPPDPDKDDPVPDATAKAARVVVVVVENLVTRTPQQAAVVYDPDVRTWLASINSEVELVSNKDVAYRASGYATYETLGLPFALVFDADKDRNVPQKPLAKFKLPDTGAAFKAEIGKAVKK